MSTPLTLIPLNRLYTISPHTWTQTDQGFGCCEIQKKLESEEVQNPRNFGDLVGKVTRI